MCDSIAIALTPCYKTPGFTADIPDSVTPLNISTATDSEVRTCQKCHRAAILAVLTV